MTIQNIISKVFEAVRHITNVSISARPDNTSGFEPILEFYPKDLEQKTDAPKRRRRRQDTGYNSPIL